MPALSSAPAEIDAPPQSIEAEVCLLGSILLAPARLAEVRTVIGAEHFFRPAHADIYRAMLDLSPSEEPIDTVILRDALEGRGKLEEAGGVEYLASLTEAVPSSANAHYYATIVRKKWRQREALRVALDMRGRLSGPCADVDAALAWAAGQLDTLADAGRNGDAGVTLLSEVEPEEVSWLWRPYIPLGKLTLLEGDPAAGKTWLALAIGAAVSRGWGWPGADGRPGPGSDPATVLYLSAEDGAGDTLRPRLDRLGGDPARVAILESADAPTLRDLTPIRRAAESLHPALIVLDPLSGYLGGDVDLHRANEVRPRLAALARLGEEYRAAVLIVRHLSKAPAGRAIYRGLGSIDITAAARSVLLAGVDPQGERGRAIIPIKASLAAMGPAVGYDLGDHGFAWRGRTDLTAADLLAPEPEAEGRSSVTGAVQFFREALANGARPAKQVEKDARAHGISRRTLQRARGELGVRAERRSDPGSPRGAGVWLLSLPVGALGALDRAQAPQAFDQEDQERHPCYSPEEEARP